MDKTEVANKVWKAFFQDGREVSTRKSNQEPDICRICGHDKSKKRRNKKGQTVCEATEGHCKEDQSIQEGIIMINKVWTKWNNLNKKAKIGIVIVAVAAIYWIVT